MWAEAARYIYKGEVIFNTKGGSLYEKPTLEFAMKEENGEKVRVIPNGTVLEKIDISAMVEANRDSLAIIEQITVKKIYDVYKRRQKSLHGRSLYPPLCIASRQYQPVHMYPEIPSLYHRIQPYS